MDPLSTGLMGIAKAAFPAAIKKFRAEQFEKARVILLKRMRKGSVGPMVDDKAAYHVWLYFRAAADGAATRNLELIAQAVVSDINDPTLISEDLKRVTDTLSSLSREEAIIIGTMIRAMRLVDAGEFTPDQVWPYTKEQLTGQDALFDDIHEFATHAYALLRTGWVVPISAYGELVLRATSRLAAVGRMVEFDEDVTAI